MAVTAERLRQAAARLRDVESDATHPDNMHPWGDRSLPRMTVSLWAPTMEGYLGGAWGVFAGVLSPPVALALADWLDHAAVSEGLNCSPYVEEHLRRAHLVANAILGET